MSTGFGQLLLRVHFYAGVLVAPFLLVAATTGLLYVFTPQLEQAYYPRELTVSAPAGAIAVPLSQQVSAARNAHPAGDLLAVRPGEGDATTQVDFSSPGLDSEHAHTLYVNPYTGAVTGRLTTWWATTPLKTWFDDLHTSLHLGRVGFLYSEFAASWLWVIALGGVFLWWRRQRGRRMLRPDLEARRGVRRTRSWHASTGLWLTIGLLFLSATGLTWSEYAGENFGRAVDAMRGSRPAVTTALTGPAPAAAGGHHAEGGAAPTGGTAVNPADIDKVYVVARSEGLSGPMTIAVPADAATAWSVTEQDGEWPVRRDSIAVDGATGAVTDRIDFADWPLMAKFTQWGVYAHMGDLFGLANQLVLAALALGLICVIVWGYRMWWQRRPTRAGRRAVVGAPPVGPGAWQRLPAWAIVVGVPALLAVCYLLPLFGVPLAVFLLADLAGAAIGRHRSARIPVSPAPAGLPTPMPAERDH